MRVCIPPEEDLLQWPEFVREFCTYQSDPRDEEEAECTTDFVEEPHEDDPELDVLAAHGVNVTYIAECAEAMLDEAEILVDLANDKWFEETGEDEGYYDASYGPYYRVRNLPMNGQPVPNSRRSVRVRALNALVQARRAAAIGLSQFRVRKRVNQWQKKWIADNEWLNAVRPQLGDRLRVISYDDCSEEEQEAGECPPVYGYENPDFDPDTLDAFEVNEEALALREQAEKMLECLPAAEDIVPSRRRCIDVNKDMKAISTADKESHMLVLITMEGKRNEDAFLRAVEVLLYNSTTDPEAKTHSRVVLPYDSLSFATILAEEIIHLEGESIWRYQAISVPTPVPESVKEGCNDEASINLVMSHEVRFVEEYLATTWPVIFGAIGGAFGYVSAVMGILFVPFISKDKQQMMRFRFLQSEHDAAGTPDIDPDEIAKKLMANDPSLPTPTGGAAVALGPPRPPGVDARAPPAGASRTWAMEKPDLFDSSSGSTSGSASNSSSKSTSSSS